MEYGLRIVVKSGDTYLLDHRHQNESSALEEAREVTKTGAVVRRARTIFFPPHSIIQVYVDQLRE